MFPINLAWRQVMPVRFGVSSIPFRFVVDSPQPTRFASLAFDTCYVFSWTLVVIRTIFFSSSCYAKGHH